MLGACRWSAVEVIELAVVLENRSRRVGICPASSRLDLLVMRSVSPAELQLLLARRLNLGKVGVGESVGRRYWGYIYKGTRCTYVLTCIKPFGVLTDIACIGLPIFFPGCVFTHPSRLPWPL